MACFATPYGLHYAAHCFNRAYAQNNRPALIPAGGKLGVTSSFANYMEHHLGPELHAIKSFTFSNPTLTVTRMGHMAYGYETYGYRIELEDGRVFERDGVATSVLSHDASGWKIVQYHSSSRAPRN